MIQNPRTRLKFEPAERLVIEQSTSLWLLTGIQRWWQSNGHSLNQYASCKELPLRISVMDQGPRHSGLGSGTQLSMALACGMYRAFDRDVPNAATLATVMRRGKRSAIGTHGFLNGGFLVDKGLDHDDTFAQLDLRFQFPDEWRVVLCIPKKMQGLHGNLENKTFDELVDQQLLHRDRLIDLCHNHIVPAIEMRDYSRLQEPLFEFNRLSGEYFSQHQFGCYHSATCAQIVEDLRATGVGSVGQSSWGPCIFAICDNSNHADEIVSRLQTNKPDFYCASNIDIITAEPDNSGFKEIVD